jgi:hypothetical protein
MRIRLTALGLILVLLALAIPTLAADGSTGSRALRDDLGRMLDELRGELEGLGLRWPDALGQPRVGPERPLISLMLRHREELALSAAQVQRLEQLRKDFEREAIRRDADLRIAEMDVATLLEADTVDLAQVEVKIHEIERVRAELRLARIRTIEQGKAQLTPEQRATLRALVRRDT